MAEPKPKHKKPSFEPLVPLGIFLVIFGAVIVAVPFMPGSWLTGKEMTRVDRRVDYVSGLAFLAWGGAWFYVGWKRMKKARGS